MMETGREALNRFREWLRRVGVEPQPPANSWPLRSGEVAWILDAFDATERERDEARAEVGRLRRELAEARGDFAQMREDRDALKGALSRANELRIGDRAEARLDEREACAVICDVLGDAAEVERDACCDDRSRSLHAGRMHGADECARAIRARGAGGGE